MYPKTLLNNPINTIPDTQIINANFIDNGDDNLSIGFSF